VLAIERRAAVREKEIGGSGGSLNLNPLGLFLRTSVYMVYSECLTTRLNPLAERTCFSQAAVVAGLSGRPSGVAKV
jgi:hypothetical protein